MMELSEFNDAMNKYSRDLQEQGAKFLKEAQAKVESSSAETKQAAEEWMAKTNEWIEKSNEQFDQYVANANEQAQAELQDARGKWDSIVDEAEVKFERFDEDFSQLIASEKADAAEALSASLLRMSMKLQSQASKAAAMAIRYRAEASGEQTA